MQLNSQNENEIVFHFHQTMCAHLHNNRKPLPLIVNTCIRFVYLY